MLKEARPRGTALSFLVKEFLSVQKRRVACQLRLLALKKAKKRDEHTEWLLSSYRRAEEELEKRLEGIVGSYPIWQKWLSKVNGIGPLLAAEILGGFESAFKDEEGIEHFKTVSQMWAFAGLDVKEGKAPKRKRGKKISFNTLLRSVLLGRVGTSFLRQRNSAYHDYYQKEKEKYYSRFQAEGKKIVPASKLPEKKGKRFEPPDTISEGHIHRMALRKMIKLFVAHLWEEWRRSEGFEAGKPYVIKILGHPSYISPFKDKY